MDNKSRSRFLKRYTGLPFLIEFLQKREITLLTPDSWDDKNDSYYLQQYGKKTQYEAIYSLCLSEARETYYHWKMFSQGSSGVRIEFHKGVFLEQLMKEKNPKYKIPVDLNTINRIILSTWLAKPVAEQIKLLLNSIKGCENIDIFRSTLVDNEVWKRFADKNI